MKNIFENIPDLTRIDRKMNLGMLSPCDFVGIDLAYTILLILRSEIKDIKTADKEEQKC